MQLSINRSLHQLHDRSIILRQSKTAKGRRMVALPPSAKLLLKRYKEIQIPRRMVFGTTLKEDDLIFAQANGEPLLPDTVSRAWVKLVQNTGLKGVRLHDARHSFASLMLKNNVHPATEQQMLGHASIRTTINTYIHILPGLQEAAAALFDESLNRERKMQAVKDHY